MGIFSYVYKLSKIQKKSGATAYFTPSEIASGIINLRDARQNLTEEEFFYINVIHETYKMINRELCLDYLGFLGLCNEIIAHFDLVAPYYQYSGSNELKLARLYDYQKIEYRVKAKELLKRNLIFEDEWMELHEEFMDKFYSLS